MMKSILYLTKPLFQYSILDGLVKSLKRSFSVIPAKAGIQSFQVIISSLDSGSCRRTGVTTFYECIILPLFPIVFLFLQYLLFRA